MKNNILFLFLTITLLSFQTTKAQSFVYVNFEYILSCIPEYRSAQNTIDSLSDVWRGDMEKMRSEIKVLYENFREEQTFLTQEMIDTRIKEIEQKEGKLKEFSRNKFGYEGELFKKKSELITPIREKIQVEIEKYAKEKRYDFIFDESAGVIFLYSNSNLDRSDEILNRLGH